MYFWFGNWFAVSTTIQGNPCKTDLWLVYWTSTVLNSMSLHCINSNDCRRYVAKATSSSHLLNLQQSPLVGPWPHWTQSMWCGIPQRLSDFCPQLLKAWFSTVGNSYWGVCPKWLCISQFLWQNVYSVHRTQDHLIILMMAFMYQLNHVSVMAVNAPAKPCQLRIQLK